MTVTPVIPPPASTGAVGLTGNLIPAGEIVLDRLGATKQAQGGSLKVTGADSQVTESYMRCKELSAQIMDSLEQCKLWLWDSLRYYEDDADSLFHVTRDPSILGSTLSHALEKAIQSRSVSYEDPDSLVASLETWVVECVAAELTTM